MPSMLIQRLAQQVGMTVPGRAVGRVAYRTVASFAARVLAPIRGVEAVYATGSLYSEWLQPGYSDIDFVLIVDLRSVEEERALRAELRRRLDGLNTLGTLFRDVDYLEARDLDLLRRYPAAWALDFDQRWTWLAGSKEHVPRAVIEGPSAHARRMARAIDAARRWLKASAFLLDPHAQRPVHVETRGAKRLFADCLAARLDADRQRPIRELFERAARERLPVDLELESVFESAPTERRASRALVVELVAAALEVLDSLVMDVTHTWDGQWEASVGTGAPDETVVPVAEAALREGFVHAAQVSRLGDASMLLVVPPAGSARDHVARHVRLLERAEPLRRRSRSWAPRPVLTTLALWRAAALFDPPPFVGSFLARRTYMGWGNEPPRGPARPCEPDWSDLLKTRILHQFQRARARAFRQGKPKDALAREVLTVAPAYDAAAKQTPRPEPRAATLDERALLELHWHWMEEWRPRLAVG